MQGDQYIPQQRLKTSISISIRGNLCWLGAVKVTGMRVDFYVTGVNFNIIKLIKSYKADELLRRNDPVAFSTSCLFKIVIVILISEAREQKVMEGQTHSSVDGKSITFELQMKSELKVIYFMHLIILLCYS